MNLNVNQKVAILAGAAVLLVTSLTFAVYTNFNQLTASSRQVVLAYQALQSHQVADMMHDALRADVLTAQDVSRRRDEAGRDAVTEGLKEHMRIIREALAENAARQLPAPALAALSEVAAPLEAYLKESEALVARAWGDLAGAEKSMANYTQLFTALEVSMGKVGDLLDSEAVQINNDAAAASARFLFNLLGAAAISLVLLIVVAILVARSIPRPFSVVIKELSKLADDNTNSAR